MKIVYYYLIPKSAVPPERLVAPRKTVHGREVLEETECLEIAVERWGTLLGLDHIPEEFRAGRPRGVGWQNQDVFGRIEQKLGFEALARGSGPRPIPDLLAQLERAGKRHFATFIKVMRRRPSLADRAEIRENHARTRELSRASDRLKQVRALAPACSESGILLIYGRLPDPNWPEVELEDPWAQDITEHGPTRWLHHELRVMRLLDCLADVVINGRSWKNGRPVC